MASSTLYEGWGRSTWSDGSFGTPILKVSVDGVSDTGAVGSVSVIAEANVTPTGLEATGAVGTVSINAEANVPVKEDTVKERARRLLEVILGGMNR